MKIIDTDAGFDDLIAINYAIESGIKISAITTVFGNTTVDRATSNVFNFLKHIKQDIPIFKGEGVPLKGEFIEDINFSGEGGLFGTILPFYGNFEGKANALEFYESIKEPFHIISLGPHTNICNIKNPNLKKISISSGYFNLKDVKEKRLAWNMRLDMEAAKRLYHSGVEIEVIGLDATGDYIEELFSEEEPFGKYFKKALRFSRERGYRDLTLISDCLIFAKVLEYKRGDVDFSDNDDFSFATLIPNKKGKVSVATSIDLPQFISILKPLL